MPSLNLTMRLLLAAGLGAVIGLEREYRQKPAGLRTNILIAEGSALFTIVSIAMAQAGGTPDRITAQIVTGVGFLGGGAILRSGISIHGMTTAATIWVNAAIGMAAGAGEFTIATVATVLTLVVLAVLPPIESYFERRAGVTNLAEHPRSDV
jgi:putative Mg2+ transporter-C (MgtC) family protein